MVRRGRRKDVMRTRFKTSCHSFFLSISILLWPLSVITLGAVRIRLGQNKLIRPNSSQNKITNCIMLNRFHTLAVVIANSAAMAFTPFYETAPSHLSIIKLEYHPVSFDRAVDCANNYGMCKVDELFNLAQDLENYQGCFYEEGPDACQKEIADRLDLANVLLLQSEMQERIQYLQKGNLFVHNVEADHNLRDRDNFIEKIAPGIDL